MNGSDAFATYDAAYVLGALSPQDRAAYEAHLRECPACARSVQELAGMPGLLGQALAVAPVPEPPPPDLLPALVRRVSRERRRMRWRSTLVPAAVALVASVALALLLVLPGGDGSGGGTGDGTGGGQNDAPASIAMTSMVRYPVEATISLTSASQGTRVEMECRYGADSNNEYVLLAVLRDGETEELASWFTVPDDKVTLSVPTALRRQDIVTLEVHSTHGYPVLTVDLPDES